MLPVMLGVGLDPTGHDLCRVFSDGRAMRVPEKIAEVTIESLIHGGEGLARHSDGTALFVPGVLPGEQVRVELADDRRSSGRGFVRTTLVEIIEPSSLRIKNYCSAAQKGAGCCDFAIVDAQSSAHLKRAVVIDQLKRIGKIELTIPFSVTPLGKETRDIGWRMRVRFGVSPAGELGFRQLGSDKIIPGTDCAQLPYSLAFLGIESLADFNPRPGIEVAAVLDDTAKVHAVALAPRTVKGMTNSRKNNLRHSANAKRVKAQQHRVSTLGGAQQLLLGDLTHRRHLGNRIWELPTTGFWQAHRAAPQAYTEFVAAHCGTGAIAWDLFGGAGLLSAPLVDAGFTVHLVEAARNASGPATKAFSGESLTVHTGAVEAVMESLPAPSVAVLDPPRAGAGKSVITAIAQRKVPRVIHIGCDTATFARDLAYYQNCGYELTALTGFDAFPGTHHVELLAALIYKND